MVIASTAAAPLIQAGTTTRPTGTPQSGHDSSRDSAGTNSLGKQEFLQLLIAQLRNQDPLRPMEDREFIAQLAQLNALEQMQILNQTILGLTRAQQFAQAAAYLGKHVEAVLGPDAGGSAMAGRQVSGAVTEVRRNPDGEPLLVVDGKEVFLDEIVRVRNADQGADARAVAGTTGAASTQPQ
jgi:flagellar basal-body rod modification protein FlgD